MCKPNQIFSTVTLVIFLLITLVGCKGYEHISKHLDWVNSWLNNPKCDLPCWESITPGVTTLKEGNEIASQLSGVEKVDGPYSIHNGQAIGIVMNGCDGNSYIVLRDNKFDDNTIDSIFLSTSCSEDNTTVKEVITTYGDPNYTWASWIESGCHRNYLYLEKGMLVTGFKERQILFSRVDPEILVSYIVLFEPVGDLQTYIETHGYSDVEIYPWVSIDEDPCDKKISSND